MVATARGEPPSFHPTRRGVLKAGALVASGLAFGNAYAAGSELIIQKAADAAHFDPHKVIDVSQGEILPLLTDTLVNVAPDFATVLPGLATKWVTSKDGLTYTFTIRNDVTFHDGKKLDAQGVVASFARWLAPEQNSGNKTLLGPLKSVSAEGADVVVFALSEPFADFLLQLSQPYAGIIDAENAKALGNQFGVSGLNGTGPYMWGHWKPRNEIMVVRNPGYRWGPPSIYQTAGPVQPERLIFRIVPDDNARAAAMLAGQQAISYTLPWSAIADIRKDPRFKIAEPPAFGWVAFLGIRTERPAMKDIVVRKAINQAIDREGIASALYYDEADPAPSVISPKISDFSTTSSASFVKFDPEGARNALNAAGWVPGADGIREKSGVRLVLTLIGGQIWRERAETVQTLLRDVGIELKVELSDVPAFISRLLTKNDYDLWCYFGAYMNSGEFFTKYVISSAKLSPYRASPELGGPIDKAIVAGRAATTEAARISGYQQAQDLIAANYLFVPLVHQRCLVVYNTAKVEGVKPHGYAGNGLYKAMDLKAKG